MKFALYFGNRGFMPCEPIGSARDDMVKAVTDAGHEYLIADEKLTRYGAVETRKEGRIYAEWLKKHEGEYDGVILCMPIFIDENGAVAALRDAGVPILMQAYPDEIGKLDFKHRRDAYCGKFSATDVFYQYKIPFTVYKPHVLHPLSPEFRQNLNDFAAVCNVVKGMKRFNIGCIGARTTAFKTVRFDELTLQRYGINVESFDLSELIFKVQNKKDDENAVVKKIVRLNDYADFSFVPQKNRVTLAKISVVIDEYIREYGLDAIAFRCWNELETVLRVCPCVLISELNNRGIAASCETDLCSAITMRAMSLASQKPSACLDWNNNYGEAENKVILFHCGPVAQSLMNGKGVVKEHRMFAKNDPGSGWGTNEGRIAAFDMTYSNCLTEDGKLKIYVDEGRFTEDVIEDAFFGCCGVAEIDDLQNKLVRLAKTGFKHHTTIGVGHMKEILNEAFGTYLGYDIIKIGRDLC
jgi:L-fucose isomerase-like protein